MKFGFETMQASTIRVLVWACAAAFGIVCGYFLNKDVAYVLFLGGAVAVGIGISVKDD